MTDELKKQLREGVDKIADSMYNTMLQSYELVEKDLPSSLSDEQRQQIFTQIFNASFNTQRSLLESTMVDVKTKIQNKDFVQGV